MCLCAVAVMNQNQDVQRRNWSALWRMIEPGLARRGLANDCMREIGQRDLVSACYYLAQRTSLTVNVVSGFFICRAGLWETDGPMGAWLLAECLAACGHRVRLWAEHEVAQAWQRASTASEVAIPVFVVAGQGRNIMASQCTNFTLPRSSGSAGVADLLASASGEPTCWIAIERPGPAYTPQHLSQRWPKDLPDFLARVPPEHWDRYHDMNGQDVTACHAPLHRIFELANFTTIGIGDGGNEIGMGKVPWSVLAKQIPSGDRIACRVATDWLIPAGVSNWGAYALAAGVCRLRGLPERFLALAEPQRQKELWHGVLQRVPLCDGVTGFPANQDGDLWVDGLPWSQHAAILNELAAWVREI